MNGHRYLIKENGAWIEYEHLCDVENHFFSYLYNHHLYRPGNNMRNYMKAEITIAGGRGIKKAKDFCLLNALAYYLDAEIGISRPLADQGWFSRELQIGINGRKISSDLYIAIGISGKFQHMVGLRDVKHLMAINVNKEAEIFENADFGIVGDYKEILSSFLQTLTKPSR